MTESLDIVRTSGVLTERDMDVLQSLSGEMRSVIETGQVFRTRTEMEVSVLNDIKRPTPDAKYWQSVREQSVMFEELVNLSFEYRKTVLELQRCSEKLRGDILSGIDRALLEVERDRLSWVLTQQERVAHHRIRELQEWSDIKTKLINDLECGTEDPGEHQLASYAISWLREIRAGGLETGSAPERINLAAKADAALKLCADRGILPKVLAQFPSEFLEKISRTGIEIPALGASD